MFNHVSCQYVITHSWSMIEGYYNLVYHSASENFEIRYVIPVPLFLDTVNRERFSWHYPQYAVYSFDYSNVSIAVNYTHSSSVNSNVSLSAKSEVHCKNETDLFIPGTNPIQQAHIRRSSSQSSHFAASRSTDVIRPSLSLQNILLHSKYKIKASK